MLRRHWDNRKYGTSKLKFPHAEAFLPKLSDICVCAFKMFASPVLGRESLIIKCFKGRQIINLLGGAHMSRTDPGYYPKSRHTPHLKCTATVNVHVYQS